MQNRLSAILAPMGRSTRLASFYGRVLSELATSTLTVNEIARDLGLGVRDVRYAIDAIRGAGGRVERDDKGRYHFH